MTNQHPSPEMELAEGHLHEEQVEQTEQAKKKPGQLEINYANETQSSNRAYLKNGAQVSVEALKLPSFEDSRSSQLVQAEQHSAEVGEVDQDAKDKRLDTIDTELTSRDVDKEMINILARIFRSFGDQVGMVKKGETPGFDPWKEGHRFDFDKSLMFVIAESRADEMKALIKNPPAASTGEIAPAFRVRPRFDWFAQENGKKKLGMVFYYEGPNGEETKPVVFLFGQEKATQEEEEQQEFDQAA